VVEDDAEFRASLGLLVQREDFAVSEAASLDEARALMAEREPDVVFVDLGLPDGNGLDLLTTEVTGARPDFVVITGNATVETVVDALRQGALDFLTKPIDRSRLRAILANAVRTRELRRKVSDLRGALRDLGRFGSIVGRSPAMQQVYDLIARVAPTQAGVLILGESGTGKELVAATIHQMSTRAERRFLAINCGAVAPNVIESELFGHERGSFTGAERSRKGYFEEASGGTLMLDEITEMPGELQVKLLRVIESGQLMRVGASDSTTVDVRVIAATNRDAGLAVREGRLREDLYYRLNVFPIALPPLRERGEDIVMLAEFFLAAYNAREGGHKRFSDSALRHLQEHRWPGNVRELRNLVERMAILSGDVVEVPGPVGPGPEATVSGADETSALLVPVGSSLADVERRLILATLQQVDGNKKETARRLGISLKTLYNRLNVYQAAGLRDHDDVPAS